MDPSLRVARQMGRQILATEDVGQLAMTDKAVAGFPPHQTLVGDMRGVEVVPGMPCDRRTGHTVNFAADVGGLKPAVDRQHRLETAGEDRR